MVTGLKPMLARVKERETRGEAVGQGGLESGDSGLWIENRAEWGHHLIRLVTVLLPVAINSVT